MNSRKHTFQDVIDPFEVKQDWFILDFPSLQIKQNPNLDTSIKDRVISTINRLKLNDEYCISSRFTWLMPYCEGDFTFNFLKNKAPFIAYELERQELVPVERIAEIMSVRGD